MSVYYHGSDGHIKQLGDQELQHWKYIKKIGNRYFYTLDELKAYYNEEQQKVNREKASGAENYRILNERKERDKLNRDRAAFKKDIARNNTIYSRTDVLNKKTEYYRPSEKEFKKMDKRIDKRADRNERANHRADKIEDVKRAFELKTRAGRKTAKMVLGSKKKPKTNSGTKSKYSKEDIARIRAESLARKQKRDAARKKKKAQENARNSGAIRAAARR